MRTEKRKAAPLFPVTKATASTNNRQNESYRNCASKSSGKIREKLSEQVVELLAYLQNPLLSKEERKQGWQLFEPSLRRYLDLKVCGGMV